MTEFLSQTRCIALKRWSALATAVLLSGCQMHPLDIHRAPSTQEQPAQATEATKETPKTSETVAEEVIKATPPAPAFAHAWQRIYENPGIEHKINKRILEEKEWYLTHPAFLSRVLARSEPFLGYVVEQAHKRKVPLAIALLPVVESRYNPHAISKAGAVGPWQFMPATAAHFDLKMNWWYDGRRDVIASTDAALTYLDQLQKRFDGDWLLALASYNVGAGNVNKAIRRNKANGLPTDYWSLKLPRETSQYVPRLLALLSIIENAEGYGVDLPQISAAPKVAKVHTLGQIDVARAAHLVGMSEPDFRALNPGLRRWASDPQGPFNVLVPREKAERLKRALLSLPAHKKISWQRHTVKPGDTISDIANKYQVPTTEFKRINQLSSSFIRVGQSLLVPKHAKVKTLGGGDKSGKVMTLGNISHEVVPGDTLWGLSRKYKTSIREIAADNNLPTRAPLRIGKVLNISTSTSNGSQKVNYKVKAGDSLYGIAKQFKVSIGEIANWNALDKRTHIRPGQELTLYLVDES